MAFSIITNRTSIATLFAAVALTAAPLGTSALADGTHPDGHGGAVCKGIGHCLVLELDCKGTYTDATDSNGTVYGKCSQTAQINPQGQFQVLQGTGGKPKRLSN